MHKYIINKNNILYKNYAIRMHKNRIKAINLVSYDNLIEYVSNHINYSSNSRCFGNWKEGIWLGSGLNCHSYMNKLSANTDKHISKYLSIIDNIDQFNHYKMDDFWFLICLIHLTDALKADPLLDEPFYCSWIKKSDLDIIFQMNNIKNGMEKFATEGLAKGYILEINDDEIHLNKDVLFTDFYKAIVSIEKSFKEFDKAGFINLNNEVHELEINQHKFYCFKNKIFLIDNNNIYFTHFNDLNLIVGLPQLERENEIYNQLIANKNLISNTSLDELPHNELTGQMTAFFLKAIISNKNSLKFPNKLPNYLYRELSEKNYIDISISFEGMIPFNTFTDKIIDHVSSINNNDFAIDFDNYVENVKHEHTAITYIKNKAKQIKKQTGLSLMKAQEMLVENLFGEKGIVHLYKKIKADIKNTLKNNKHFIYKKDKDENLVLFGKNHIGYYSMKDISNIKNSMVLLNGDKLISQIKAYYEVIEWKDFDIEGFYKDPWSIKTDTFIIINNYSDIDIESNRFATLLGQTRSMKLSFIFNFKDDQQLVDFFQLDNVSIPCNVREAYFSRTAYELLYGKLDPYKIAVKHIFKTDGQTEYLV